MEQYPSNSHKTREKELNREPLKLPEKKMQKATLKGAVRTKKKSTARKLLDTFVVEDYRTIKDYVLNDVLKPAIRDAIEDIVTNGIFFYANFDKSKGESPRYMFSNEGKNAIIALTAENMPVVVTVYKEGENNEML